MNIYVLGDVASFVATLNSVVMILGVQSFVSGAALLGALVGLLAFLIFLTNKDAGQSVIPGGSPIVALLVFFVFFTSIGIKQRVVVTDVYTGNTNVVNNVPALIAMPASAISTAAYKIFDHSNTAFQSTNGSFMALGPTGYVAPLQILHTLRNGMESIDPLLAATTRQFIVDCVPGGSLNPETYAAAADSLTYILTNARDNGLTTTFTTAAPAGAATSCAQAKDELSLRAQNLLSQNDAKYGNKPKLVAIVNDHLKQKNPAGNGVNATDIEDAVQRVILDGLAGTAQTPSQFMLNVLFYNTLTNTFNCLDQSGDQSTFNSCDVMMTQASEQWKTDSAAAGSLFAKTMMPAMVFMQLMFYGLAPIVIIFGLIRGAGAVGMYIKFLGFGVWTASWMPVAAVIQMYIQNNVSEKLAQISNKALTAGNFKAIYYDVISTNLSIASDMLAATPLVTATILGVSGMAISQLANNMGGKDRVDEKVMSPDLAKSSPLVQSSSMSEVNSNTGIATQTGAAAPKLHYNAANSASMASANSVRATDQESIGAELSKGMQAAEGRLLTKLSTNSQTHAESGSVAWRTQDGQSIVFGNGATSANINSAAAKAAVNSEAQMAIGAQINAAAIPGVINALRGVGKNVTASEAEKLMVQSAATASAKDAGFMSRLMKGDGDAIGTLVEGAAMAATVAGTLTTGPVGAGAGAAAQVALRSGGTAAIVKGVQKVLGASAGAADRLQGASAAIFGGTGASAQANLKANLSVSNDLQNLNSNQQDQVARVLADWSRQDSRSGDVTDTRMTGTTASDSSTRSTTATIAESLKTAQTRTASSDQAFQRNAQQAMDSGVRFEGSADQFAQFLRANPSVAKDLENRIQKMEPVISGDAAKMRQLIDNSVRSGMTSKERDLVAGAMALAGLDREFNPMSGRDPAAGLHADSNSELRRPDVGSRVEQAASAVPAPGQIQPQQLAETRPVSGTPYTQAPAMTPGAPAAPAARPGQPTAPAARPAQSHSAPTPAPAARGAGQEQGNGQVSRTPSQARSAPAPASATAFSRSTSPGGVTPGAAPTFQALQDRQQALMPASDLVGAVAHGPGHGPLTAPDARSLDVTDQMAKLAATEFGQTTGLAVGAGTALNVLSGIPQPERRGSRGAGAPGAPDATGGAAPNQGAGSAPGTANTQSQPAQRRDGAVLTGGSGRPARRRR